jgi:nicotinate-nucleotide--dimethylbenzimidazole phosphoribosyltransferase
MALTLSVVDAGVSHDFGARAGLVDAKIEHGTANYGLEPAMWRSQLERALERGRNLAHEYAAQGCNALGFGAIGVGASASATLLAHCLTGQSLDELIDEADAPASTRRHALLERALARAGRPEDPLEALREFGGFEIVMMTGAMLGAAERRLMIVADGAVAACALLAACRIAAPTRAYAALAGRPGDALHARLTDALGLAPLLDLGVRGGDGVAAALAMPLLRAAAACPGVASGLAPAGRDSQST